MRRSFVVFIVLLVPVFYFSPFPGPWVAEASFGGPSARSEAETTPCDPVEERAIPCEVDRILQGTREWMEDDFAALHVYRPGYSFWRHIFTIPDGSIAFGSALDGRLLALFPQRGEWPRGVHWEDPVLVAVFDGERLQGGLLRRRERAAEILEREVGPVLHNPTRGGFLLPNARRYGGFLREWGTIYERFGVPAELGLAQAIVESGLHPTIRSPSRALGFCQWLEGNWNRIKRLAPHLVEGHNQTTQAPYCAAYLTVLAAKYRSFIPALSEHHAGGANVGRIVIKGGRLGGEGIRAEYFLGSEFALSLREGAPRRFRELYRTYGPRSYRYAEMVFGNTINVVRLRDEIPQERIFAMRATRNLPIAEVTRRSGLSVDEVRRYNPALIRQVPRGAHVYLPMRIDEFGPDVSFWHRPPDPAFASILDDFLRIEATLEEWDDPSFEPVLREFQRRFQATGSEEGSVMATMIAYVIEEMYRNSRPDILREFRTSARIDGLIRQARQGR